MVVEEIVSKDQAEENIDSEDKKDENVDENQDPGDTLVKFLKNWDKNGKEILMNVVEEESDSENLEEGEEEEVDSEDQEEEDLGDALVKFLQFFNKK